MWVTYIGVAMWDRGTVGLADQIMTAYTGSAPVMVCIGPSYH